MIRLPNYAFAILIEAIAPIAFAQRDFITIKLGELENLGETRKRF